MDYTFSDTQLATARAFAEDRLPTSLRCYKNRRANRDETKIFADIANGALAEMAAEHMLRAMFESSASSISSPDFTVYETAAEKSFDPDMTMMFGDATVKTHVKSFFTSRKTNYKPSFCFQKAEGERHTDKDLAHIVKGGQALDLLVVVLVKDSHYERGDWASAGIDGIGDCCTAYGPFSMQDVVDMDLWRAPYSVRVKNNKRVLYLHDLLKLHVVEEVEVTSYTKV